MSGTEQTLHLTEQDVRKVASQVSGANGGNIPSDSAAAAYQSIVDSNTNKAEAIKEAQSNLPLPDKPSGTTDSNSASTSINASNAEVKDAQSQMHTSALREPTTGPSAVRVDGDELNTNTEGLNAGRRDVDGIPNDAVTRDAKDKAGLVDTTN